MGRGTTLKLDGAAVKVVDIQESVEELGSAAELEYTPEGGETETFWIFKNYPGYDPIHRKNSRYTFTVESLRPRFNTELIVTKNPGLYWYRIGAALFMVTLLLTLFFSQNRFWFVWTPGKVRVLAASSKFWVFEPRFNRMMAQFKHRVTRMAKG
jgi:hypothetical protein